MAKNNTPKMSLVAQYDDLTRYTKVLTSGSETEFKLFVENQLNLKRKVKEARLEASKLNSKVSALQCEKERLETQMKHLKDLLQDSLNKLKKVETEKNSLERQIIIIKEVLSDGVVDNQTKEKLGFLNSYKTTMNSSPRLETIEENVGSLISLSDVDRTDDFGESDEQIRESSQFHATCQPKEKRTSPENKVSPKRTKLESVDREFLRDLNENILPHKVVSGRSNSEPAGSSPKKSIFSHPIHNSDSVQFQKHPYEFRRCNTGIFSGGTPVSRYSTGGKLSRSHAFVVKTLYRPEKCHPCQSNIGFLKQSLKCQDCRVICHPECKEQCPLPCIPLINTPTKGTTGMISDYTSSTPPMIPPLIVYCVNEIESRGLRDIGLYRLSGSEREVKDLKEKFLNGRSIPSLVRSDVHALCGTIKEFLRSLKDPLVTRTAWQDFVNAADLRDSSQSLKAIYDIVADLPQPNRDTLAFLILHLQRVADSPDCKMPITSLAKMLGPTIVGYSVPEPVDTNMFKETEDQFKVMKSLLSISPDLWKGLLNIESDVFVYNTIKTPEGTPAPKSTRLGPVYPPGQKPKSSSKTPLTARPTRNSRYNKSVKMFSSPLMR